MQRTLRTTRTPARRPLCGSVLAVVVLAAAGCAGGGPSAGGSATEAPPDIPVASSATPLPDYDPHSSVGRLADGFPDAVVPVPLGARVVASSASVPDGAALQDVSLNLDCADPVEALDAFYAQALTAQGFVAAPEAAPSGLTALTTFTRPGAAGTPVETVVVGIYDDGPTRLVTVSAQIAPPAP